MQFRPMTPFLVVQPFSVIAGAMLLPNQTTVATLFVIFPVTFIDAATSVCHFPFTLSSVMQKHTTIDATIRV